MQKVSYIPLENILADDPLPRMSKKGWIFDRRGGCQVMVFDNFILVWQLGLVTFFYYLYIAPSIGLFFQNYPSSFKWQCYHIQVYPSLLLVVACDPLIWAVEHKSFMEELQVTFWE